MITRRFNIILRWNFLGGWPLLPIWIPKGEDKMHFSRISWLFINLEVFY